MQTSAAAEAAPFANFQKLDDGIVKFFCNLGLGTGFLCQTSLKNIRGDEKS